ncbi:hypothetical protein CXB51_013492 [Gossypium anomalum]|uniref:Uncharacterized protein n=1 Tax=Gossypium anomalum TaxID=47600 RepID=A0A8J5ZBB2_9ROSI|nr:hypothetical protein CXB51_013492 [Gossypium anomalum]
MAAYHALFKKKKIAPTIPSLWFCFTMTTAMMMIQRGRLQCFSDQKKIDDRSEILLSCACLMYENSKHRHCIKSDCLPTHSHVWK